MLAGRGERIRCKLITLDKEREQMQRGKMELLFDNYLLEVSGQGLKQDQPVSVSSV